MIQTTITPNEESVSAITEEAISFLRSIPEPVLVRTSGGKDSIVTTYLVKMAGLRHSIQSTLTGIDPPEMVRFIRENYSECSFVRPKLSFWHLLTTHNPPGGTGRGIKWCCTKIKERPSAANTIKNRVLGIRAEESTVRAGYERTNHVREQAHFYPIFHWKEWQVWEFIERYKLPYPKLYDIGFDRVGCVICPNHSGHHERYRALWPKHFDCFERYVKIWFEKRRLQGREMWHETAEDFLSDWYDGRFYYYRHKKIENQIGIFE